MNATFFIIWIIFIWIIFGAVGAVGALGLAYAFGYVRGAKLAKKKD